MLDLTGVYLSRFTADALSDVLAMEWGLSQLVLDECDLADDVSLPGPSIGFSIV